MLFDQVQVRRHWDDEKELWYFSIVDVIAILTESSVPKRYWSDLKNRMKSVVRKYRTTEICCLRW